MAYIPDSTSTVRTQPVVTSPPASTPPTATTQSQATGYSGQSTFTPVAYSPNNGGSTGTAAPTSQQPLNAGQMKAADYDYDHKVKNQGAGTTRAFIELANKHKGEPDYLAELVNRAKEKSPGTLDYVMGPQMGAFKKDPAGNYGSGFTDDDRQTIVDALGAARSKGYLTDQEIRDHAARSPGWQDVANRMGVSAAGVDPATEAATSALKKAQDDYDDAHRGVEELDQQLGKELAKFGGALDDKQRAAYVTQFKDLHKDEYGKEAKSAEALAKVLGDNRGTLEQAAVSDPDTRGKLYTALKDVASSESPKVALEYSADLARPESGDLRAAFADHPDFEKDIAQPAMAGTPAQLMTENGGDAKGAFAQVKEMAQPLLDVSIYGKAGYELFKSTPEEIKEAWQTMTDVSSGDFKPLEKLAEKWKDQPPGAFAKGIASAALSLGFGMYGSASDLQKGDLVKAVNGFAAAGKSGLEVAAGATKALADAGKLAQYTDKALKFADYASKLAPVLGVVVTGTTLFQDIQKASKDDGNAGYGVSVIGDTISVLGSALECFPASAPVGMVFNAVGSGVTALGDLIGDKIEDAKLKDEEKKGLKAAGFSDSMVDTLMSTSAGRVKELTKDLKLTPEQIQKLAVKYPALLLEASKGGYPLTALKGIQKEWNLDSGQMNDLLNAIGQGSSDPNTTLAQFANRLTTEDQKATVSQVKYREQIQRDASDSDAGADETTGFKNALAYLDSQRTTTEGLGGPGHSREA